MNKLELNSKYGKFGKINFFKLLHIGLKFNEYYHFFNNGYIWLSKSKDKTYMRLKIYSH